MNDKFSAARFRARLLVPSAFARNLGPAPSKPKPPPLARENPDNPEETHRALRKARALPLHSPTPRFNVKFYFDSQEYGINDIETGNYYFWDLTIPDHNITIEYQSSAWHADPTLTEDEWKSWNTPKGQKRTAHEVLTYDYNKARSLYKNRGIITYYVWEKTQEDDIERILCLLKTQITKY
jgi:hypothetical protein